MNTGKITPTPQCQSSPPTDSQASESLSANFNRYVVSEQNISNNNLENNQEIIAINNKTWHIIKEEQIKNKNKIVANFTQQINSIYSHTGKEISYSLTKFITILKNITDINRSSIKTHDNLKKILNNLKDFVSTSINLPYYDTIDFFSYFYNSRLQLKRDIICSFISIEPSKLQEIAKYKDFYRYLISNKTNFSTQLNLEEIHKNRVDQYEKNKIKILKNIDKSSDNLKKDLITKYAIKIVDICIKKDIDLDSRVADIFNLLIKSTKLNNDTIEQILQKITLYFSSFDDINSYMDTSILTDIFYDNKKLQINKDFLLSITKLTDKQIQSIASAKDLLIKSNPWIFQGFLNVDKYILLQDMFQKDRTIQYNSNEDKLVIDEEYDSNEDKLVIDEKSTSNKPTIKKRHADNNNSTQVKKIKLTDDRYTQNTSKN